MAVIGSCPLNNAVFLSKFLGPLLGVTLSEAEVEPESPFEDSESVPPEYISEDNTLTL